MSRTRAYLVIITKLSPTDETSREPITRFVHADQAHGHASFLRSLGYTVEVREVAA